MKKELEYEQAPSGYVTLYNYKEPFMKFDEGYGYQGVLLFDGETDKVQCHYCGEWFLTLGNHINKEHGMRASQYKALTGLATTTALIGEKLRDRLIAKGLEKRMANLRVNKGHSKATRQKIANTLRENRAEMQNLRGTCPLQLISRLQKLHEKLGRTPTDEEIPFHGALDKVYGNIGNACKIAGIPVRKPGQNVTKKSSKYKIKDAVAWIQEFISNNGKKPRARDWIANGKKGMYQHFSKKKLMGQLVKEATLNKYVRLPRVRYSKEELIALLQLFEKTNGRKPSYSDCRRGLLPHLSRYSYNFGSWKNALRVAFGEADELKSGGVVTHIAEKVT